MKISHKKPPHYKILVLLFGFDWSRNIATFGDTVHFSIDELPDHLIVHEEVHTVQQRHSNFYATWWWVKYILSRKFRFDQEFEAYERQYSFFIRHYKYSQWDSFLDKICQDLSGSLYGNLIEFEAVRKMLRLKVHGYE